MAAAAQCPHLHEFDESYLRGLRMRDAAIETHFVSYFTPLLQIKLRKRLPSAERIQDVLQETFVRVLDAVRAENGIRRPESFGAFVHCVCANVLQESYRYSARYAALDDLPADPPDQATGVDEMLAAEDTKKEVHRALARLSPKERHILRAVLLEDRDKDEICRELGVDRNYLRLLLHRAKQQFAMQYKETARYSRRE